MPGQSLSDLSVDIEDDLSEDDMSNMSLEIEDVFAVDQAQVAEVAEVAEVNVESVAKIYVDESLLMVENRLSRGELKCLLHNIKKR